MKESSFLYNHYSTLSFMKFSSQIQVRVDGRVEAMGLEATGHPTGAKRIRLVPLASHSIPV